MRNLAPLFLLFTLFLTSCSSEETTLALEESSLKTYKISKDSQGRYSIDYEVKENVATNYTKNLETKYNEIHLFEDVAAKERLQSEKLSLENSFLKLGLYENGEKSKSIIIEDDNIVLAKGEESDEFLESYSIKSLDDDNYQLDFEVKEGISVSSEYNELDGAYEIHLKEGNSNGLEFVKTYVKISDVLKINFVNHIKLNSAKGNSATNLTNKKPKFVVTG